MEEGDDSRHRRISRRLGPRRLVALTLIALGSLVVALVASYFIYGVVATSKLDELVYTSPNGSPATSNVTLNPASFLEARLLFIYPGDKLHPKYWDEPLWAGTDPLLPWGLPEGYEAIDGTTVSASLHSLAKAQRIQIPIIGLDSTVQELEILDLGDSRAYETPKNTVGHIPQTANPGEEANGWFFGHLESPIRGEGNVFRDLPQIPQYLRDGNSVYVILESKTGTYLYQVNATDVVHQSKLRIDTSQGTTITLVACVPRFKYDNRLLVTAKLVGVKSQQ